MTILHRAFIILFLFTTVLGASEKKQTLCLNMIVKDEKDVIKRCLDAAKPLIDYWVIVDTGSTDGTQEIIREHMKDIPGELHERPWVDFGHNRSEAIRLAEGKSDYTLICDADDLFSYDKDFKIPALNKDSYQLKIKDCGSMYNRTQLVKSGHNWYWEGVLHEYIASRTARTSDVLPGLTYVRNYDGARSKDPKKFQKDAEVLKAALEKDPTNSRYAFYLAQSYKDAGMHQESRDAYQKRVDMGGWDQEVFWSLLQMGHMDVQLEKPTTDCAETYCKAYLYRPTRAEPLYYIAKMYRMDKQYHQGYIFAKKGSKIPLPQDYLFVEKYVYDYALPLELSLCAYWTGRYGEAKKISEKLLADPDLPQEYRDCVEKNMVWIEGKLKERKEGSPKIGFLDLPHQKILFAA